MLPQLDELRLLLHRYLRRFFAALPVIDAARLTQRLERRVPSDFQGPAARAILGTLIVEMAGRHGIPVRW